MISGIKVDRTNTIPSGDEFTDIVLKDESAKHVENAVVHREFHWFVQEALEQGVKRILILGAFGLGKCLVKGTEVLTYSGDSKKVENVKIGDLLMGDDNEPRKVLFLGSGVENSYKITLRNGDSFSCNESHILSFIVSNRVQGLQKGDKLEISVRDYLKLPEWVRKNCLKLYKVPLKFSYNKELPLRPYLYGLWLGDGHLSGLHFTINNKDTEIVTYLHRWAIMYGFQVREDEQKGECTRYDLTLGTSNSKKYDELNFLKQFRGHGKYIDRRYLINAKFVRLQVLAGLIDTDGYLCGDTCYEIATKYLRLRDDILFLCRSLGFHVSHRVKDVNGTNYYVIVIGGDIYQIPCRTRKKAPFKEKIKNPLVYGFDIECIGEQEYFGFGVDGNKRFLLKDFTVAHNTEQISIGYVLEQIARNTNIRIKIVSNTDDNAADRVRAIRTYIDGDEDYNRLAPHVKRTPVWGNSKFIVARKSASKDGTVEAYGIFGSATGGRADLIVFDDPQDLKTAVLEPIGREKCIEVISSVWLPRLVEHGVAIILMNRWHECLHFSSKINTLRGLTPIYKVTQEDTVFTYGGISKVLKTSRKLHKGEIVHIRTWYDSSNTIKVTPDHRVLTDGGWKEAGRLSTEDYLAIPILKGNLLWDEICSLFPNIYEYKRDRQLPDVEIDLGVFKQKVDAGYRYKDLAKEFNISVGTVFNLIHYYGWNRKRHNDVSPNIVNDDFFWYFVGYWVAEGSFTYGRSTNKNVIRVTFGNRSVGKIDEFIDFFEKWSIICREIPTKHESINLTFSSYQIATFLKENFGEYAHSKKLPYWFFSLPEDKFFEFLRGYLDGDGYQKSSGDISVSSVSEDLIINLRLNLLRFGIISSICKMKKKKGFYDFGWGSYQMESRESYNLQIFFGDIERRFGYIDKDLLFVKIKKLKRKNYSGWVFDLTTSSGNFLAPSFIVHNCDVANWVQMNPEWAWMSIGVSEDFMKLEVTKSIKGVKEKYKIHPWKEPAYFMQKRVDLGERAYNRGFRLIPYSDDEMYFPSFPKCCDFGEDRAFIIKRILKTRNCLVVCGIDYSSMKRPGIAMVTVIVDKKTERRYFAEVVALREPARLMQHMVRVRREYGVDLFMAENNATQELVTELLSTFTGLRSARIEGFHTGKNKADPELGLSSLENEFEKRMWKFIFPEEPKIENEKTDVYTRAYFEIKEYPFWTTTDIVMALWFCRQGIDLLMRKRLIPVIY